MFFHEKIFMLHQFDVNGIFLGLWPQLNVFLHPQVLTDTSIQLQLDPQ